MKHDNFASIPAAKQVRSLARVARRAALDRVIEVLKPRKQGAMKRKRGGPKAA